MKLELSIDKITGAVDEMLTRLMKINNIEPEYNEDTGTSIYDVGKVKKGIFTFADFYTLMQVEGIKITEMDFYVEVDPSVLDLDVPSFFPYSTTTTVDENEEEVTTSKKVRDYFQFTELENSVVIRLVPCFSGNNVRTEDFPNLELFSAYLQLTGATNILTEKEKQELIESYSEL